MYIQPIIDLWTMKPAAFVLVNSEGEVYQAQTPHELYECIDAAYFRDLSPLVVSRLECMGEEDWTTFLSDFPDMAIYTYEDGKVTSQTGEEIMANIKGPISRQWVRGIATVEELETLKHKQLRYGSGDVLAMPEELILDKKRRNPARVQWA